MVGGRGQRPTRRTIGRAFGRIGSSRARLESHARLRQAGRVHPDAAELLRAQHAAVRVLAEAESEAAAYPALLAAIGSELGCNGALWLPDDRGELRCVQAWPADAAAAADLAPGVWDTGRPAARTSAFAFPLPGVGVMAFSTAAPLEPDANLLATMDSLGAQMSQFAERCRAQARTTAILDAAFDCTLTMDAAGRSVEANRATERTFG